MKKFAVIWAALLILAGVVGVLASSVTHERAHQNDAVRTFVCFFEGAVLESKNQTSEQKVQAVKFFNEVTRKLDVPACPAIPERGSNG